MDFALAGWIVGSVLSSVGLILINKVIMHDFGFRFVFTLTAAHFLITAAGMEVMAWMSQTHAHSTAPRVAEQRGSTFCSAATMLHACMRE